LQPFDIKWNNASAFQTPIRRPIPPSRPFPPPLPTVFCRDAACRVSVTTDPSVETQRAASPRQQRIQGDGACPVSTGEDVYRETQHAASLQAGTERKRLPGDAARCVSTGDNGTQTPTGRRSTLRFYRRQWHANIYRETQHAASLQNGNAAPCHIKIFVTNPCSTGSKLGTRHIVFI